MINKHIICLVLASLLAMACSNMVYSPGGDRNDNIDPPVSSSPIVGQRVCVVTVALDDKGQVWFSYNGEKLRPFDFTYTRMMRALCELNILEKQSPEDDYYPAEVIWAEPIDEGVFSINNVYDSTPPADGAPPLPHDGKDGSSGPGGNSAENGLDVLVDSWITSCEDAYLTIHYKTWWGKHPVHHDFYLVSGFDPIDPYTLVFQQDSHSDSHDELSEGIVCFDINNLPDTGAKAVTLTLKWTNTNGGEETAKFEFKTRK